MDTSKLRIHIRQMMANLNMGRGSLKQLANEIGKHPNSIYMAMSGWRKTPGSIQILYQIKENLEQRLYK